MAEQPSDMVIFDRIRELLISMKENKPDDRSSTDRLWSIAITETEKLMAFWLYIREDIRDYPDMRTDVRQEVARKEAVIRELSRATEDVRLKGSSQMEEIERRHG